MQFVSLFSERLVAVLIENCDGWKPRQSLPQQRAFNCPALLQVGQNVRDQTEILLDGPWLLAHEAGTARIVRTRVPDPRFGPRLCRGRSETQVRESLSVSEPQERLVGFECELKSGGSENRSRILHRESRPSSAFAGQ